MSVEDTFLQSSSICLDKRNVEDFSTYAGTFFASFAANTTSKTERVANLIANRKRDTKVEEMVDLLMCDIDNLLEQLP